MSVMNDPEQAAIFLSEFNHMIEAEADRQQEDIDPDDPWEIIYKNLAALVMNATNMYIGLRYAEEHIKEQKGD